MQEDKELQQEGEKKPKKKKVKPDRSDAITNQHEELEKQKQNAVAKSTTIELTKIKDIHELTLKNNEIMYNRVSYSHSKLLELANSIESLRNEGSGILETGIINPITLRTKNGKLERISGEHRIKASLINEYDEVPTINLGNVSDELARYIRSSENLSRDDLNPYDETLSILEHIQLSCNFENIEDIKKFFNKAKNQKAGKTTFTEEDKVLKEQISEVFKKIGRYDIITFVDRLSMLNLNELVKQAMVDEIIGYSQAKIINSKLKDENDIKKIISLLKEQSLSVSELKKRINDLLDSKTKKVVAKQEQGVLDQLSSISKPIDKKTYSKLGKEKQAKVDNIYKQIIELHKEANKIAG